MKFGQLINIPREIFFSENHAESEAGKLVLDRFLFFKGLGIVSTAHFAYDFQQKCSCYILLTDQISLPGCLYFLRYWAICVLQLFVNQVVTSWILKLTLSF